MDPIFFFPFSGKRPTPRKDWFSPFSAGNGSRMWMRPTLAILPGLNPLPREKKKTRTERVSDVLLVLVANLGPESDPHQSPPRQTGTCPKPLQRLAPPGTRRASLRAPRTGYKHTDRPHFTCPPYQWLASRTIDPEPAAGNVRRPPNAAEISARPNPCKKPKTKTCIKLKLKTAARRSFLR